MRIVPVTGPDKRPKMLTPGELAAQLRVDVRDLKRLRDEGRGPAYITLTPRTIRYLTSEVADWLSDDTADQRVDQAQPSPTAAPKNTMGV